MNKLEKASARGREVERFEPKRYRLKVKALEYGIEEAKRIRDWPLLEAAVDGKIEEQGKFVAWWGLNVGDANRPKRSATTDSLSAPQAEKLTGMRKQRVSDLGKRLKNVDRYRVQLLGTEYRAALLEVPHVRGTFGTGENEWHTPQKYLELARQVLGEIDLDPASSDAAQAVVQAKQYFTKEQDGLSKPWQGRVWLNPPYAQPLIAQFVAKLVQEWQSGRTSAAIMLTHNYTDTAWFQNAALVSSALCFTRGRVRFVEVDGSIAAPTQGQVFWYFGTDTNRFADVFGAVGFIR